jgi:hypothetical protein
MDGALGRRWERADRERGSMKSSRCAADKVAAKKLVDGSIGQKNSC